MIKMIEEYTQCILLISKRISQINAFLKTEIDMERQKRLIQRKAVLYLENKELASAIHEMEKYMRSGDADA